MPERVRGSLVQTALGHRGFWWLVIVHGRRSNVKVGLLREQQDTCIIELCPLLDCSVVTSLHGTQYNAHLYISGGRIIQIAFLLPQQLLNIADHISTGLFVIGSRELLSRWATSPLDEYAVSVESKTMPGMYCLPLMASQPSRPFTHPL